MPKQVNEHPQSKINQTLGVAKKLSGVGLKFLSQLNSTQATPIFKPLSSAHIIEGTAHEPQQSIQADQQDIQQILGAYLPHLSQRFLGKHYGKVSQVAHIVSPVSTSQVVDFLSQRLGACANRLSTVEQVLEQAGAKNLDELRHDLSRSGRISQALVEQNKWFAATQGAFAAVTGFIGVAVDVPSILILALRAIYQTGRAYGFELNEQEREAVDYIFKQIRIDILAEKQSLLFGLNTLNQLLQQNDVAQLQRLFGSNTNSDWLRSLALDDDGQLKWGWLNKIPHFSTVTHLTPIVAAGVGAGYNWRFIQDVGQKSQHVFSVARDYLEQHPEEKISILDAYQQAVALVQHPATTPIPLPDVDAAFEKEPVEPSKVVVAEPIQAAVNEPHQTMTQAPTSIQQDQTAATIIETKQKTETAPINLVKQEKKLPVKPASSPRAKKVAPTATTKNSAVRTVKSKRGK